MGVEGLVFDWCTFSISLSHEMTMLEPPKVVAGGFSNKVGLPKALTNTKVFFPKKSPLLGWT
jgi:hypothetical protein